VVTAHAAAQPHRLAVRHTKRTLRNAIAAVVQDWYAEWQGQQTLSNAAIASRRIAHAQICAALAAAMIERSSRQSAAMPGGGGGGSRSSGGSEYIHQYAASSSQSAVRAAASVPQCTQQFAQSTGNLHLSLEGGVPVQQTMHQPPSHCSSIGRRRPRSPELAVALPDVGAMQLPPVSSMRPPSDERRIICRPPRARR
jgi:hypothetical protein